MNVVVKKNNRVLCEPYPSTKYSENVTTCRTDLNADAVRMT